MGTSVSITVLHSDAEAAGAAIRSAYAAVDAVERSMSTYRPESEISRLNRAGTIDAGADLLTVTRSALEYHRLSGGAFDPTMLPLLDLHAQSFQDQSGPPSREQVEELLPRIDARGIRIEGRRISLPPGARMTLDAIAKGYAIDRAIEALRAAGIEHALVDAGGDVRAMGDKAGAPWQVAMQDPRDAQRFLAVIPLADAAVATSGDYRRYFDPDMRYHHILDPRTGESAEELISVSVQAETAMAADALATSVFVLGVESGLALIERLDGVEAFLVTEDREVVTSTGW